MSHPNRIRLSKLSLGLLLALAAAPVFAQSTSAGVGGQVVSADGQPVAGAEVTITHVDSGTVSRITTDASGRYSARGLRVANVVGGMPYQLQIAKLQNANLVVATPKVVEKVAKNLPAGFPPAVSDPILGGLQAACKRLAGA